MADIKLTEAMDAGESVVNTTSQNEVSCNVSLAATAAQPHIATATIAEVAGTTFAVTNTIPATAFRLFDLPAELQLHIYELVVTENHAIQISYPLDWSLEDRESINLWQRPEAVARRTQPALTRVNRAIRYDALKLYYKRNSFLASYCRKMASSQIRGRVTSTWLNAIGAQNLGRLGELEIQGYCAHCFPKDPTRGCFGRAGAMLGQLGAYGAQIMKVEDTQGSYMVTFPEIDEDDEEE